MFYELAALIAEGRLKPMKIRIALAGNPNCGKTTMFNDLTGSSQYVGNWPGVTVEKKEGRLRGHEDVIITDLPGIYSLSPYSLEEVISRNYLVNEKPEAVINIVDGTNLERNLYLTTQIVELGLPVVIALNMIDVVKKSGDRIDIQKLGAAIGCEVVETSALKGSGTMAVAEKAVELAKSRQAAKPQHKFSPAVEDALAAIAELVAGRTEPERLRWYSVKLFERDQKAAELLQLPAQLTEKIENLIAPVEEKLEDDSESIITSERYQYIAQVVSDCAYKNVKALSTSDKIDRVVTNRWLALPIFAVILTLVYYVAVTVVGGPVTDFMNDTLFGEWITGWVTDGLAAMEVADWLQGLIVDGLINGVGTVLGFVPQIAVLFILLGILEDCGYMARIAFIMDRIFRRFGLSGKSFIPLMIATGCGVPALMGTRTIEDEKDRRMTLMLTTFMPCSAKLVIISMITSTFFPDSWIIAPAMYFLGIAVIVLSGIALKKLKAFGGEPVPFVMELPAYHVPAAKSVLLHMWERTKAFMIKAGTIIFLIVVLVWFLSSFSWNLTEGMVDIDDSILAGIGGAIGWIFAPLGFGDWKGAVATISALMAKESAISTLAVLQGVADADNEIAVMQGVAQMFTPLAAFSYMILNLFDPPCIVAMATLGREMKDKKWTAFAISYQIILGYCMALITYQLGGFLFYDQPFGIGQSVALAILALMIFFVVRPASRDVAATDMKVADHSA